MPLYAKNENQLCAIKNTLSVKNILACKGVVALLSGLSLHGPAFTLEMGLNFGVHRHQTIVVARNDNFFMSAAS